MIDLEELRSIFHQVIPMVSHIAFHLPEDPLNPKNIGEYLKGSQKKIRKA